MLSLAPFSSIIFLSIFQEIRERMIFFGVCKKKIIYSWNFYLEVISTASMDEKGENIIKIDDYGGRKNPSHKK